MLLPLLLQPQPSLLGEKGIIVDAGVLQNTPRDSKG